MPLNLRTYQDANIPIVANPYSMSTWVTRSHGTSSTTCSTTRRQGRRADDVQAAIWLLMCGEHQPGALHRQRLRRTCVTNANTAAAGLCPGLAKSSACLYIPTAVILTNDATHADFQDAVIELTVPLLRPRRSARRNYPTLSLLSGPSHQLWWGRTCSWAMRGRRVGWSAGRSATGDPVTIMARGRPVLWATPCLRQTRQA